MSNHKHDFLETSWSVFREAFDAMQRSGIKVCLLRDDPLTLSDLFEVDVLVSSEHMLLVDETLRSNGWRVKAESRSQKSKKAYCIYKNGDFLWIDVHYDLIQNGLVYMDAEQMLESCSSFRDSLHLPSREGWLLHVMFHIVLGKRSLPSKYCQRIQEVVRKGFDEMKFSNLARSYKLEHIALEIVASPIDTLNNPDSVLRLRARSQAALSRAHVVNRLVPMKNFFRRILGFQHKYRKGFVLAVIGVDGAGKSSFINALTDAMKGSGTPIRQVYMGPWDRHRLSTTNILAKLGANPLDLVDTDFNRFPGNGRRTLKKTSALAKRFLYYGNILPEMWFRYVAGVFPHRAMGRLVLLDRSLLDIEIGYKNQHVGNSAGLRRALIAMGPQPDLTICLSADPEKIFERKGEDLLEDIRWAVIAYENMSARREIRVIKTESNALLVASEFLEEHWSRFV